jgi:hypothetical protein
MSQFKQISPNVKVSRKIVDRYEKCGSCRAVATYLCWKEDKPSHWSCQRHVNGHLKKLVELLGETATGYLTFK